jgi:aerobic-type carbon monoxide dehydrogenase small subunit (CoxS/CutS family)
MDQTFTITINGKRESVTTDPDRPLLDVLREDLNLTGAKFGCGERQCGACMVMINGRTAFACSTRIATAANREVTTIEGIFGVDGGIHPVQQAFLDECSLQCGYCTAGMVVSAVALLKETPKPTEAQIVDGMQSNICRCGTYGRIVKAVQKAAGVS